MIPEGSAIGYECENGHVNDEHTSTHVSADRGSETQGLMPACVDCGGRLTRTLIPLRECDDCGNVWPYTGDADRPTCPSCQGKRTSAVSDE